MSNIFQKPPNNYQYLVGIANIIDINTVASSVVAPVTNGNLHSLICTPNVFVQDGQKGIIRAFGNSTAHGASSISMNLLLNGVTVFTGTITANGNTRGFDIALEFMRRNSTTFIMSGFIEFNVETVAAAIVGVRQGTVRVLTGLDLTQQITFQFQATDAAGAETITMDASHLSIQ